MRILAPDAAVIDNHRGHSEDCGIVERRDFDITTGKCLYSIQAPLIAQLHSVPFDSHRPATENRYQRPYRRRRHRWRANASLPLLALGFCCALLTACASPVPVPVRDPAQPDISLAAVQQTPDAYLGRSTRWGGRILEVDNGPETTRIKVLARRLEQSGRPDIETDSPGRFIAEFQGFVDPTRFPLDRLLTVVGPIIAVEPHAIGEYRYPYPVVAALTTYLWPKPEPVALAYPYGYGWWGPGFGPFIRDPWCCGPSWYGPPYGIW
ncbi:Outer membrane protein slp precursor [Thiorhodovibrio litoralis]|nr:Slp family lipoprotein [Thiorhodovibrio winogradskyi]WPL10740.1 Outer membrane protein slp precursor [Thiorhodovibrio litoralis]